MKNTINKALITLLLLGATAQTHTYIYEFFNHTKNPMAVAIQFRTENEPLYKRLIHPHTLATFGDGEGGVPEIKDSYCLAHIRYVKAPTTLQKKDKFATAPWKEISITWTPVDTYHAIIETVSPHPVPAAKHKVLPAEIDQQKLLELIKSIKKPSKPQTLCVNRRFDIIEDEHGKIYFISPLIEL